MRRRELGLAQHEARVRAIEEEFGESLYEVIAGMRQQGCKWSTIAGSLDVTEQTLQKWRTQLSIPIDPNDKVYEEPRGARDTSLDLAQRHGCKTIAELMYQLRVVQGMTKEEAARHLGVSERSIYTWSPESINGHQINTEKHKAASRENAKQATLASPWRNDW
jgi:transposase-like protein